MDRFLWIQRCALYLWLFTGPELRERQDELTARAAALGEGVPALLAGTPGVPERPGLDDGLLVAAVRKGLFRREAFQVLYVRYAEWLVCCAFPRWDVDADTAWDLAHDLFLRLWSGRFDGYDEGRPFRAYFYQAAHNAAVGARYRTRRPQPNGLAHGPVVPGNSVLDEAAYHELEGDCARALDQLPARQREVLERSLQGQGYGQIMSELGISYEVATGRLFRARQHLRELLSGHALSTTSSH